MLLEVVCLEMLSIMQTTQKQIYSSTYACFTTTILDVEQECFLRVACLGDQLNSENIPLGLQELPKHSNATMPVYT
jgi:hypothetical protein